MTRYRREIDQCPNCGCKFITTVAMSISAFGANTYTDGFVGGSSHVRGDALLICPECTRYVWTEDLLSHGFVSDKRSEKLSLPWADKLCGQDFENLLRMAIWNSNWQEEYIRIRAWWSFNTLYRDNPEKEFELSAEQEKNLLKLLQLFDTNSSYYALLMAEIYRQLGQFEQCLTQLDLISDDDYLSDIETIKSLAHRKKKQVAIVPPDLAAKASDETYDYLPPPSWLVDLKGIQSTNKKPRPQKFWDFLRKR